MSTMPAADDMDAPGVSLRALVQSRMAQLPDAVAVIDDDTHLSTAELSRRAHRVAVRLRQLGIAPEEPVIVVGAESADLVVACLGVVTAGGAYVALDPHWPQANCDAVLRDCHARIVVASSPRHLPAAFHGHVILLHGDGEDLPLASIHLGRPNDAPEQLFSIVYTSGTTGTPKGVLLPRRAVLNRLQWIWDAMPYRQGDVSVLYRSAAAIGFTWDWLGPLLQQVPIVVQPTARMRDAGEFVRGCARHRITHVSASPGRWGAIIEYVKRHPGQWRVLRGARSSGEALRADLVAEWQRVFPGVALLNIYGTTECCSATAYDTTNRPGGDRMPAGWAVRGVTVHVLDEASRPASPGSVGEVCVGGGGVARGYFGRPSLTAARFTPDPWSGVAGARLFRTGDAGTLSDDGRLDLAGRLDRVIKVRGFRVELDEVEATLQTCSGVRAAAVTSETVTNTGPAITAYILPDEGSRFSPARLRLELLNRMPEHMVPTTFVEIRELPITASGKIHRAALRQVVDARTPRPGPQPRHTAPQEALSRIWCGVFELDAIDVDDNFFELGGHSLLAMEILSRVHDDLGVELGLQTLLDNPTIRELADHIAAAQHASSKPVVSA